MPSPLESILNRLYDQVIGYLPNLFAGIVLAGIGWALGWLAKRIVVQLLTVLRFDRFVRHFAWGQSLAKADVRFAIYDAVGSLAFFIVFLILFSESLDALRLAVLSAFLTAVVTSIPKFLIAVLLLGLGWIVAGWLSAIMQRALAREDVPQATFIARLAKAVIILFFSAMALTELNIAPEIVVIGFSVTMVTLGAMAVVLTAHRAGSLETITRGRPRD
jgi:hypothetical protein